MNLAQLQIGESAKVREVSGNGETAQRLMELGFVEEAWLKVLGRAPWGGPLQVKLRGCSYAIRQTEAELVELLDG